MTAVRSSVPKTAEIVRDPHVMSGEPIVSGTRVPVEVVLAYLRAGHSTQEIFEDYPTLPLDGMTR